VIPARLIRTVPAETTAECDELWRAACEMHPTWEHLELRDPIDPENFPRTAPYWRACRNGAQLAGLIRLEALEALGGIYLDSDVAVVRSLEELRHLDAFAAWEDHSIVPDAVLGATAGHPAIEACLELALERIVGFGRTWQTDRGAWSTGPGVTTTILPHRDDVVCLPPGSFYPVHYAPRETLEARLEEFAPPPWCYGVHRWSWSWR
jgi:mannosyltransferase OCH1-like enzyme